MNNDEEKRLVEKKPNIFKRIFYFLFPNSSTEIIKENQNKIEFEETNTSNETTENVEKAEDIEESDETDDISDYTEEDIINLQTDYEKGKIDLKSLTENQTNLLFTLYMEQINTLSKSNEEKKQKLLEYKNSMNS